jgi:hypothetical protein
MESPLSKLGRLQRRTLPIKSVNSLAVSLTEGAADRCDLSSRGGGRVQNLHDAHQRVLLFALPRIKCGSSDGELGSGKPMGAGHRLGARLHTDSVLVGVARTEATY